MSDNPPSTADRIVEAALRLFNENGYSNVPMMRLAMHLSISPGHLAYHFRRKTDIVLAVFPRLEAEVRGDLRAAATPGAPFRPLDAALTQIELFRILWRYRFVFNALTQLAQEPELLRRFLVLQENIIAATQKLFDDLVAQGDMLPIPQPATTRILAKTQWMVWLSWLRFEQIENPGRVNARNAAVYDGVMQGFCNIRPYFDDGFTARMIDIIREQLPEEREEKVPAAEPPRATRKRRAG